MLKFVVGFTGGLALGLVAYHAPPAASGFDLVSVRGDDVDVLDTGLTLEDCFSVAAVAPQGPDMLLCVGREP